MATVKKVTKKSPAKKAVVQKAPVMKTESVKSESSMASSCCGIRKNGCCCKKLFGKIKIKDAVIGVALLFSVISMVMSAGSGNVGKWIDENPQKVIDSLNKYVMELQQTETEDKQKQAKEVLPQVRSEIINDKSMPYAGNARGDAVVIEFFDYNCGHCKTSSKTVAQLIKEDKNVKVILVELPIFGGPSTIAAKVVLTVKKVQPSKVHAVHKALMNGNARTEEGIYKAVRDAGVSVSLVKSNMEKYSAELDAQLQKNREHAMKLGINGTPAFIIGDELIPGAVGLEQMKEYVAKSRK